MLEEKWAPSDNDEADRHGHYTVCKELSRALERGSDDGIRGPGCQDMAEIVEKGVG